MKAKITVNAEKQNGIIHQDIYGHFLELVYHCFYGGLWAEMLKIRKFEGDDGEGKQYGVVKPWFPIGRSENTHFMHDNTIFYSGSQSQKIVSRDESNHKIGIGQRNLYLNKNKSYEVRINLKQDGIHHPIVIALEGENTIYAKQEITLSTTDWTRFEFKFTPSETDRNGSFTITFQGEGSLWLGTASLMPDDHLSGYRRDVVEVLRDVKPPNLRWPGGNFVSYYHWEDGIGDRDQRPSRPNHAYRGYKGEEIDVSTQWEPNDVGIDEFMELCRLCDAKPYIAVNSGNGTPEEAAQLVEYCNGSRDTEYGARRIANGHEDPYDVVLWGIGNEMFGNWQNGHVDEETYARRHLAMAKAMLAVDPRIELVATGGRYWFYPGWNQAFFRIAKGTFHYLSLHSYAKKYRKTMKKEDLQDPEFAREFYYYIISSPYGIEEQIDLTGKEIEKAFPEGPEIAVAFDEWNCWAYRAPNHQVDFALRDGLYTAGVFHAFRRQWNIVKLANFAMTVNNLPMIRVNRFGLFFNPQYLIFKMYLNHQGPYLIESKVECETFPAPEYEKGRPQAIGNIPYLDASVTMSEDGKTLFLGMINMHDSQTIETEISLTGWEPEPNGKMICLDGEHYMTENTFEEPENITIKEEILEGMNSHMIQSFPPHSVTILELFKKG